MSLGTVVAAGAIGVSVLLAFQPSLLMPAKPERDDTPDKEYVV